MLQSIDHVGCEAAVDLHTRDGNAHGGEPSMNSIGPGRVFTHDLRYLPPTTGSLRPGLCSPSTRYRFGFTHRWGRQGARSRGGRRRPKRRAGLPRWGSEEHRTPRRTRPEVCCRRMEPRRDREMRRNRRTVRSSGLSVTRQVRRRRKVGCCTHGANVGESTVLGPRIERVLDQEPRDKVV